MARLMSVAMLVVTLVVGPAFAVLPNTLKVYLLAGQSNMQGQAYTYDSANTDGWNIPTMQFLLSGTPAATNYLNNMPASTFTFKSHLNSSWLQPRNDVWGIHRDSGTGSVQNILPTNNQADMLTGIQPMQPGFGAGTSFGSMFGPELAMGINIGNALTAPVFLFKSDKGGTDLAYDWRPPSAVAARGGAIGINYTNTVSQFKAFLDTLDADLKNDGKLNAYNDATGYEVCGFVWLQGWNESSGSQAHYTTAQKLAEYQQNLVDLVHDIRASDSRIPSNLGAIIPESTDQNVSLNASRAGAVAVLNGEQSGTAVFFENNNMIGTNWGNNEHGVAFSTGWGYHFNARAENFLEVGWRIGQVALDNGFVPEPATMALLALGGLALLRRRRNR
jgi:hypothetical protein